MGAWGILAVMAALALAVGHGPGQPHPCHRTDCHQGGGK